jgi:two-component system OmpR family response regulator
MADMAFLWQQLNITMLLLIDRMLPRLDGLTIIKTLRGSDNNTPVLILSALGDVDDKVKGLKAGGDDYLVKPLPLLSYRRE